MRKSRYTEEQIVGILKESEAEGSSVHWVSSFCATALTHVAFRALQRRRRPDCIFSELNVPPRLSSIYASLCPSR
jgi:hypothetical protein